MDKSKFLGKVLGIYLIIVSVAMVVNMAQFATYVQNLIGDTSLMFVSGFFTVIIGLLLVVSHNVWQWNWRVLITIIGWLALLKGISIIFYPHVIDTATLRFVQNMNIAYTTAGIDFVIGLILCYFGFKR